MDFVDGVTWRASQRGLVVCGRGESPFLIEHEHAVRLPEVVAESGDRDELVCRLGGSLSDRKLVDDLIDEQILRGAVVGSPGEQLRVKRVVLTRSGLEFSGIDSIARVVHRLAMPVVTRWPGRVIVAAIVVGGVVSLAVGRPDVPQVSQHPWIDATLGLVVGLVCVALHELAHAVALVHYGRRARRAGFGFYWGAISFFVDSSEGITLPRRARVINALAGLAVDVVLAALLLITAQLATPVLIVGAAWRVAILQLLDVLENGLPILEVDGNVALSDYLDEPDLGPRAREALSRKLRRIKYREQPSWLPAYGAFSLIGGLILLISGTWIWWTAVSGLLGALFSGNPAEILLGAYLVVPFGLGVLASLAGLVIELITRPKQPAESPNQSVQFPGKDPNGG